MPFPIYIIDNMHSHKYRPVEHWFRPGREQLMGKQRTEQLEQLGQYPSRLCDFFLATEISLLLSLSLKCSFNLEVQRRGYAITRYFGCNHLSRTGSKKHQNLLKKIRLSFELIIGGSKKAKCARTAQVNLGIQKQGYANSNTTFRLPSSPIQNRQ